ncbi:bifunctional DNA-binding transcriptional regulator/O6-methylguanine-DNA methyltransferase Ada [soil metagenome]
MLRMTIDTEKAWAAFSARDRAFDGQFVGAVKTTGIYCKPSCAARHPLKQNVAFYPDGAAARTAGFRACLRCKPDELGRDREAVARALALIEGAGEVPGLEALAHAVGYAPHHFHRLFKRDTGLTPAAYARGLRAKRVEAALEGEGSVTDAIYDAGYQSASRFYAAAPDRLGMTPSAWKNGGAGVVIRYAIAETALGSMLLAATDRGICRLSFDEDEEQLRRRFPNAVIEQGGGVMDDLVASAVAAVADPGNLPDLPLDVAGTVFQQAIWRELARIPAGETLSYAALAAKAGNPNAVRAAGSACGANRVAVLIPCHRALRTDGSLGGFAYGLERKVELLKREAESAI